MAAQQPADYTIFCVVVDKYRPFVVDISPHKTVAHLKEAIKLKKHAFDNLDADDLDLYIIPASDGSLIEKVEKLLAGHPPPLEPTAELSALFPGGLNKGGKVHILVQPPRAVPIQEKQISSPLSRTSTAPRVSTVDALYQRLSHYHFVLVRGTPASGKSTLAKLLAEYIRTKEGIEPILISSWQAAPNPFRAQHPDEWVKRLPSTYDPEGPNTIIIDEGQLTYWDIVFWNKLKETTPESSDRVILFASYGSPTGFISSEGTPGFIPDRNQVSLRPVDHRDHLPQAGLLLTRDEFTDMVHRSEKPDFEDEFLEWVFCVTAGHIGAVADLLSVVSAHDSYRDLKNKNAKYSLEIFKTQFPIERLHHCLESVSVFRRGLPPLPELQNPQIARVFRAVLVNNSVSKEMMDISGDEQALDHCFKRGWLHATTHQSQVWYIFTTPLHKWFVDYYLGTEIPMSAPINQDLRTFAINVIRRFSRMILSTKRQIVGASSIQRPPEAQYQDEFYRCCHKYSNGSLISFPEFGDASGRVDFYIPCNQWGVELLRDGNRLKDHSSRFTGQGAYAKMKFSDYILLDFRTGQPQKKHPGIPKLYHVVFNTTYSHVRVIDGSSWGRIAEFELLN